MAIVVGKGVDMVNISRIEQLCRKEAALRRLFTEAELRAAGSAVGLARRFALKEAFLKALGTGLSKGIGWHDVEFVAKGCGGLRLHGRARPMVEGCRVHYSSTHSGDIAVAVVLIEGLKETQTT